MPDSNPPPPPLRFRYRNHRGEVAVRRVIPREVVLRLSLWHGDRGEWLLVAWDVDRQAVREFRLLDVIEWLPCEEQTHA